MRNAGRDLSLYVTAHSGEVTRSGARDEARHVTQICHSDQDFRPLILQDDRSASHKKSSCGIFLFYVHHIVVITNKWTSKNNTKNRENYLPSINIESSFFTNFSRMCWNLEKPPNQSQHCSIVYLSSQQATSLYLELFSGRQSIFSEA